MTSNTDIDYNLSSNTSALYDAILSHHDMQFVRDTIIAMRNTIGEDDNTVVDRDVKTQGYR